MIAWLSGVDWTAIGGAIGMALTGLGGWWAGRGRKNAQTAAVIAESKADESEAKAASVLYDRLREEIDALRADVSRLRADLDVERRHSRALELHVWALERLLRELGKEPPQFNGPVAGT